MFGDTRVEGPTLALVLATTHVLAAGCALPEPSVSQDSLAIVGGELDDSEDAVVALIGDKSGASFLCSGVVVGPRTILTSAHCVADRDSIEVVFGENISQPSTIVSRAEAVSWVAHPLWSDAPPNLYDRRFDLGLISLGGDAPVEPALVNHLRLDEAALGEEMRLRGYGDTAEDAFDSGRRRLATTTLRSFDNWWTSAGDITGTTCIGDSGGPQLATIAGVEVVASITSFGTAPPEQDLCQHDTIGARVDTEAISFIDAYLEENDTPGVCGSDGECSEACPAREHDPDCIELCESGAPECEELAPGLMDREAAEDDAGDGCRVSGSSGTTGPLLFLALLVALRRRRS